MRLGCGLFLCLAVALFAPAEAPNRIPAPLYVPSSIVNAANPNAEGLAPNTIASVYGTDLAFTTRAVGPDDIRAGVMPVSLPGTGVKVLIGGLPAHLYYVSPGQINFLVPSLLMAGTAELRVGIDGRYGPAVRVRIAATAPALFQADPEFLVATKPDGSVISASNPARPEEVIILYATGLGNTVPQAAPGEIAAKAAVLEKMSAFRVRIGDTTLSRDRLLYAGVTPGFAGLYQINVRLPDRLDPDPEVRIGFDDFWSPAGVRLLTGNPSN